MKGRLADPTIIGTYQVMEIGKRYVGLKDHKGDSHPQPFVVLREATMDEWMVEARETVDPKFWDVAMAAAKSPDSRFYEISTD